jgi:hypothetical protein
MDAKKTSSKLKKFLGHKDCLGDCSSGDEELLAAQASSCIDELCD